MRLHCRLLNRHDNNKTKTFMVCSVSAQVVHFYIEFENFYRIVIYKRFKITAYGQRHSELLTANIRTRRRIIASNKRHEEIY